MFSGGKDPLAALLRLQRDPGWRVERLITTLNERNGRVDFHGTPKELLRRLADLLGLPLTEIELPEACDNATYRARVADGLEPLRASGLQHIAFGDLYLADIREFRERQMQAMDMTPLFPLWHMDTTALALGMIEDGIKAVVCCVDREKLSPDLLGRQWGREFIDEMPHGIDPCGENGEFHTMVIDAPIMRQPLAVKTGGIHISHERFHILDYQPA